MFRYAVVTAGILLFSSLVVIKLFRTTITDAEHWNKKANDELTVVREIQPVRGDILACDGSVLATNVIYYELRCDYRAEGFNETEFYRQLPALADSMARHFPRRDRDGWKEYLSAPLREPKNRRRRYHLILDRLNRDELELTRTFPFFDIRNPNKTGIIEKDTCYRDLPFGDMARRCIGQVGQNKSWKGAHGWSGLEKSLDSLLYGRAGLYKRVPLTKKIGQWTDIPPQNGRTVISTIDIALQDLLEQELNAMLDSSRAEWATAILMHVPTGDIKAISNLEQDPRTGRYVQAYNRAVVAYEPGSVVKTISMLIALEDGLVNDINETFEVGGAYSWGSAIRDSHSIGQTASVKKILAESSNKGMTKIIVRGYADKTQKFVDRFASLGLLEKMNSGIAEEENMRVGRGRGRRDMANMCFGYSTAIPPLRTLSVYNAIANGGRYVRPRLVRGFRLPDGSDSILQPTYIRDRICSETNAGKLTEMLESVVQDGTAKFIKKGNVRIAAKTGTANYWDTIGRFYDKTRNRLALCGYFPAENPQYSIMVLTFNPRSGPYRSPARSSGRVVRSLAEKMYARGLLGNRTDFRADAPEHPLRAVAAAGTNPKAEVIGNVAPQRLSTPSASSSDTLPNVLNLPLRQALAKLEADGYEVSFSGTGRVAAQHYDRLNRKANLELSTKY